ncbi:hypothetical protein CsSME_00036101 [Camellia sinensis var. sinensis]
MIGLRSALSRSSLQAPVHLDRATGVRGLVVLARLHGIFSWSETLVQVHLEGKGREQCGLRCVAVIRGYVVEIVGIFG